MWQEYFWGDVGGDCHIVLIWFVLLKLRLFLPILNYLQKYRALKICWTFKSNKKQSCSSHKKEEGKE